ncbi:MAG: glycosyltransferase family 4 protein [Theionarchaea archaeon]|nr:glycosyltransferase family 4 protein [Theionarchaea archaeon]
MMMRLLLASCDYPPDRGGIQVYSRAMARALHRMGDEVTILAAERGGSDAHDAKEPYGILRPRLSALWALRIPVLLLESVFAAKRGNIEAAIATNWYPSGLILGAVSRIVSMKMVIVCHGLDITVWNRNPIFRRIMRWSLESSDAIVSVSRFTKGLVLATGVAPSKVEVVNPGIERADPLPDAGPKEKPWTILSVSRLVERKGLDDGIRSVALLSEDHVIYQIIGDGPERGKLSDLAWELGLSGFVQLRGEVSDEQLAEAYSSAKVFLLPSRTIGRTRVEGFGMVLLEAQRFGLPIVSTKCGGIPEAVDAGKTAVLLPERDLAGMAGALTTLYHDEALRRRTGKRAREWAGKFDWDLAAVRIKEILSR